MIRIDYINGDYSLESYMLFRPYKTYLETCLDDLKPAYSRFLSAYDRFDLEYTVMESVSDDTLFIYESEKKSFLQQVGEKILELRDKFIELVNKIIDKIKTASFNNKSNVQKLEKLIKDHPELKNETIAAFNDGTLNLTNIKSFKELDDSIDTILKMAKKGDIDPDSLQGKWEAAKKKFEENRDKIQKTAVAGTAVIGLGLAIATLSSKRKEAVVNNQKFGDEIRKKNVEAYNVINGLEKKEINYPETKKTMEHSRNGSSIIVDKLDKDGNDVTSKKKIYTRVPMSSTKTSISQRSVVEYKYKNAGGIVRTVLDMIRYRQGKYTQAIEGNYRKIEKMENALADFVDKIIPDNVHSQWNRNMQLSNEILLNNKDKDETNIYTHKSLTTKDKNGNNITFDRKTTKTIDNIKK